MSIKKETITNINASPEWQGNMEFHGFPAGNDIFQWIKIGFGFGFGFTISVLLVLSIGLLIVKYMK